MSQGPHDFTPRRYRVRHQTTYTYNDAVDACYERGFLIPRPLPEQMLVTGEVAISPHPDFRTDHVDYFGNTASYLEFRGPFKRLRVTKVAEVDVHRAAPDFDYLNQWTVAQAAVASRARDRVTHALFASPSQMVTAGADVAEYAATLVDPDMGFGDAALAVARGIYRDFLFRRGVTTVRTTLPEILALRAGVCQDFTHLALGVVRGFGLAARYVSGYIETTPPPGTTKMRGSDASHAWVGVLAPDGTWLDVDPTNDHVADSRYIVTAWGRDFRDVSPLKGVVYTEASSSNLKVGVDVERLDDDVARSGADSAG